MSLLRRWAPPGYTGVEKNCGGARRALSPDLRTPPTRSNHLTILPPLASQSAFDTFMFPWPLQPFLPAQEFPAPWHELCPLQALMPWQFTSSPFLSAAEAIRAAPVANIPATEAAIIIPLMLI